MVIPSNISDVWLHIIVFINGILTGALVGVVIYRNVALKWDTKKRTL